MIGSALSLHLPAAGCANAALSAQACIPRMAHAPFLALATIACASCSAASSRWMPSWPAGTSMLPCRAPVRLYRCHWGWCALPTASIAEGGAGALLPGSGQPAPTLAAAIGCLPTRTEPTLPR
jgi:hypothetical protein